MALCETYQSQGVVATILGLGERDLVRRRKQMVNIRYALTATKF